MATWDGSDQAARSEEENFYLLTGAVNSTADPRNWDYYAGSEKSGYTSHRAGGATATLHEENNVEGASSNNAYHGNTFVPPLQGGTDGSPCFFENNRALQQKLLLPYDGRLVNYVQTDTAGVPEFPSSKKQGTNRLAEYSNLHAGASEFVPSSRSKNMQKPTQICNNGFPEENQAKNVAYTGENSQASGGGASSTSHIFFSDNRHRAGERHHDNSKGNNSHRGGYKNQRGRNYDLNYGAQRLNDSGNCNEINNVQSEDNSYRGRNQRIRNNSKFANERYSNNRQQQQQQPPPPMNEKSTRPDRRKMQIDHRHNHSETYNRNNAGPGEDNFRDNGHNTRGKWTRNDRRFQNDRYAGNNRQGNEYEEQQNPDAVASTSGNRWEISHNRDPERIGRNERTRGKVRDPSSNFEAGHEQDAENYERETKFSAREDKKSREPRDDEILHWRQKDKAPANRGLGGAVGIAKKYHKKIEFDDDASQRERLTELLNQGALECLICCDYIRQNDPVWSCNNCYHVLHLKCLKKWAHSSQSENGWRCPACQNVSLVVPEIYHCFCGKARAPEWNRRDVAHSCGEVCGRLRAKNNCVHKCTLLCHPGACPECTAMVTRHCGCKRTSQSLKCSTTTLVVCEAVCDKTLNCNIHKCEKTCHHGDCGVCEKTLHQECHCGKHERDVTCEADVPSIYGCEETCGKLLECGNHRCEEACHPGDCAVCALQPSTVTHCCCGQTPLSDERKSCLEPIPTCDKICSKKLKCGQPSDPHTCKIDCHPAECPECELTTKVRCRCGNMDQEIACKDLRTKADDARCQKKCTKKRSCGKHKCNQLCCIDIEHICPMPCSKSLNCGRHRCQLTCHRGRCQPCQQSSFDELHCECGAATIYPPVPCGTRRPPCDRPCSRQHSCAHEVLHTCHSDPTCPPCTVLTQRWCYGKHELRKAVPCHINEISCGMPCNKPISCGRHKCITLCHSGPCEKPPQVCTQPCTTPRELCGHICAAPCHAGKCPDTPCKEMVKVTCTCGHRTMTRACAENSRDFQRIASGILASKMADMQLGHSVDLEEVFGQGAKKQNQLKTLECNGECRIIARNLRIALGLQIVNPDVSGKLMPRYTETMKQWAKKDPHFCEMVHDKLTELVQLAKTSKHKSRSYSFDSMNRDKRNFVHESCEHFGCESQAYDQEPKRNVVATAVKDKCWLPSYSLLETVQRENGQRKVPRPMLNSTKPKSILRLSEVLSSTAKASQKLQPSSSATTSSKSPEPEINYFDFPTGKPGNKWSNV